MNQIDADIYSAARIIAGADTLVIAAGAGMGVDSGLPDFRGETGFWNAYPALARAKIRFSDVANPRSFEENPSLAWGFYGHRLALYRETLPHVGFQILREWGRTMDRGTWIYTSNVDGHFQKAGFEESVINEGHGSMHHLQCTSDCPSGVWRADDYVPEVNSETCQLIGEPPTCRVCGSLARPNILMFGDWGWDDDRNRLQVRRQERWFEGVSLSPAKAVIIEIGAGTAIPSVRQFGKRVSQIFDARRIRINLREPAVASPNDVGIARGALDALQSINDALRRIRTSVC